MGMHLTRMTTVMEEIELTRITRPIGAGGGLDSLPRPRQIEALATFENGMSFLKGFPRHEVTRELLKNAIMAQNMGRVSREVAIGMLLKHLTNAQIALPVDEFMLSYSE
jgi:hypothetical protein